MFIFATAKRIDPNRAGGNRVPAEHFKLSVSAASLAETRLSAQHAARSAKRPHMDVDTVP